MLQKLIYHIASSCTLNYDIFSHAAKLHRDANPYDLRCCINLALGWPPSCECKHPPSRPHCGWPDPTAQWWHSTGRSLEECFPTWSPQNNAMTLADYNDNDNMSFAQTVNSSLTNNQHSPCMAQDDREQCRPTQTWLGWSSVPMLSACCCSTTNKQSIHY